MKKSLAICLSMLMLVATSCFDDGDEAGLSPYAILSSFSIGNIKSEYPAYTSAGVDTVEVKIIQGSSYPFSINQVTGEVYNADSLPYATNVDKVVVSMGLSGYAQIYNDSIGIFENFYTTDSLDFTTPRKFRITSTDTKYSREYTVSVNVHQVQPEKMVWDKFLSVDKAFAPLRALEFNGELCLFGEKNGQMMLARTALQGEPYWSEESIDSLSAGADMKTIQAFGGALYLAAADGVYRSENAVDWSLCYSECGAFAIVGVSDVDGKMWVAAENGLLCTSDGEIFESAGQCPAGFPLYGASIASYAMNHHSRIVRYVLVGYDNEAMEGNATVWSRLSTEKSWVKYENEGNTFSCPSLKGLAVMRYDNSLYAIGGAGVAQGEAVEALSSFYVSRDNGITWKAPEGFDQRLPHELQGDDTPFVATVDSNNVMWIVMGGEKPAVWKGIINRLGFKK